MNKGLVPCESSAYKKFFSDTKIDNILPTPEQQQYLDNGHDSTKEYQWLWKDILPMTRRMSARMSEVIMMDQAIILKKKPMKSM